MVAIDPGLVQAQVVLVVPQCQVVCPHINHLVGTRTALRHIITNSTPEMSSCSIHTTSS